MQVIDFHDYRFAWQNYRLSGRRKTLRQVVREIYEEKKAMEARFRRDPMLARLAGREDLIDEDAVRNNPHYRRFKERVEKTQEMAERQDA